MRLLSQHADKITNQKVIVRCNFDVPLEDGQVADATRIEDAVPAIGTLLEHQNQVILIAHLNRPGGQYDDRHSLAPVADKLGQLMGERVRFLSYPELKDWPRLDDQPSLILFDNLRFFPGEEANSPAVAKTLASYGDIFVNESFATSHRAHASIVGIPTFIPGYLGLSFERELTVFAKIKNPDRPFVLVMGGAKLETKEPLINKFKSLADEILVGGKLALDLKSHPLEDAENVTVAKLTPDGKDITADSAHRFAESIMQANTVIWNGTMGVFEDPDHREGTAIVARAVNTTSAYTVIGGGDTESALTILDEESNVDHISSGGGAMLTYLSKDTLAGLEALS